ncbi:hypothetical protein GGX14DRAFT_400385 [Mycena pura]|uniref:Uncharacterized protein n=1 Tax=Mycena pura TaxID=153505 RepID=A0AAD6Y4D3_9AGAR|nr:hypothetical protein GGX14DRAFT_400385 [Mycena pura]
MCAMCTDQLEPTFPGAGIHPKERKIESAWSQLDMVAGYRRSLFPRIDSFATSIPVVGSTGWVRGAGVVGGGVGDVIDLGLDRVRVGGRNLIVSKTKSVKGCISSNVPSSLGCGLETTFGEGLIWRVPGLAVTVVKDLEPYIGSIGTDLLVFRLTRLVLLFVDGDVGYEQNTSDLSVGLNCRTGNLCRFHINISGTVGCRGWIHRRADRRDPTTRSTRRRRWSTRIVAVGDLKRLWNKQVERLLECKTNLPGWQAIQSVISKITTQNKIKWEIRDRVAARNRQNARGDRLRKGTRSRETRYVAESASTEVDTGILQPENVAEGGMSDSSSGGGAYWLGFGRILIRGTKDREHSPTMRKKYYECQPAIGGDKAGRTKPKQFFGGEEK